MSRLGWEPKKDRDGREIPGCWITAAGYVVAAYQVDRDQVFAVTAPGGGAAMAYRRTRQGAVDALRRHMAGKSVEKFEGGE